MHDVRGTVTSFALLTASLCRRNRLQQQSNYISGMYDEFRSAIMSCYTLRCIKLG